MKLMINFVIFFIIFLVNIDVNAAQQFDAKERFVFAHYMVCCPSSGSQSKLVDYMREISEAQSRGIDGFALNNGGWSKSEPHYKARSLQIYEAAKALGTGFKLFISADHHALKEIPDILATVSSLPNQFRIDGRPVISTFGGQGVDGAQGKELSKLVKSLGGYFVPYFWPKPNITELPSQLDAAKLFADYPDIDGYFYFGAAGNGEQLSASNAAHAKVWTNAGKVFMASVSPYYFGYGRNFRIFESDGFQSMALQWQSAILNGANWIQIVTWNDWTESSYVAPLTGIALNSNPAINPFTGTLPHVAYLDASDYYIKWFKSGVRPKIYEDKIYYFYRLRIFDSSTLETLARLGQTTPSGVIKIKNKVFVTVQLKAAARVTISSGNRPVDYILGPGIHNLEVDAQPGQQIFSINREGSTVLQKYGEENISADNYAPSSFNYFSGSAQ